MSKEVHSPSQGRGGSSSDETEPDRPERMRDWLIRMINSNRFPGLEWMDPEKTIFKVPWIHAKKRGYNRERDAALFKEWAIHSGKYRDESDPTVWKINFRCAINGLKDIVELKDFQTEDCRVYKVLPRTRPPKRRRRSLRSSAEPYPTYPVVTAAASTLMGAANIPSAVWPAPLVAVSDAYSTAASCHYQRLPPYSTAMSSCSNNEIGAGYYCANPYATAAYSPSLPPTSACSVAATNPSLPPTSDSSSSCYPPSSTTGSMAIRREETPDSGYGGGIVVEPLSSPLGSPSHSQGSPNSYHHSNSVNANNGSPCAAIPSVSSSIVDPIGPIVPSSCHSSGPIVTTADTTDDEFISIILDQNSPLPQSPPLTPPTPTSSNQINVSVYYGSILALSKDVTCTKGCRLFYGPNYQPPTSDEQAAAFESYFGPLEAEQISLPGNHPLPQAKGILESMNRGILIEMHDNSIFLTPLCKSIVFAGSSYYQQSTQLERESRAKVFDYNNQFRRILDQYTLHRSSLSPEPHVIFSLGQSWGPSQPITQNCIFVVVTHLQAKRDLDMFAPPSLPPSHFSSYNVDLYGSVPNVVDVRRASVNDIRAESFLNSVFQC